MSGMPGLLATALAIVLITPGPDTEGLAGRARALVERGETAQAKALLEGALETGASAEAALLLARLELQSSPARSRELAARVLRADPDSHEALDVLSASHARARALGVTRDEELRLRRLEVSDYDQLLRARPRLAEARFRRASQLLAVERLLPKAAHEERHAVMVRALEDLQATEKLLADAPAAFKASVLHQLGRAHKHLADFDVETSDAQPSTPRVRQRYEQAVGAFEAALEADVDRVDAVGELIQTLLAMREPARAMAAAKANVDRGRTRLARAKTRVMVASLALGSGDAREAVAQADAAIAEEPLAVDAYLVKWQALRAAGRPQDAEAALLAAVDAEPGFVDAWLQLAAAAARDGRLEQARARFQRILDTPERNAVSLGMRPSSTQYRAGVYAQAAAWLAWLSLQDADGAPAALRYTEVAERYAPADARLLDTRGQALLQLGRPREARDLLMRARAMERFPALDFHIAQAEAALGDRVAALAAVRAALRAGEAFAQREQARALLRELVGG